MHLNELTLKSEKPLRARCACSTRNLGKGARWRAPVASPRHWPSWGIEPLPEPSGMYRRSITRKGDIALPCTPSFQGFVAAP